MGTSAAAAWELQDLYEQLVLARAAVVKKIREMREVIRDPRNRLSVRPAPFYAQPNDVIAKLIGLGEMYYLHRPGRRNRIRPPVLLDRYEKALAEVRRLERRIDELESRNHLACGEARHTQGPSSPLEERG